MKRTICTLALAALFACSAPGGSNVGPDFLADSHAVLDFSTHKLSSVTLEEFVKACQEATRFDFTYDESTQTLLQENRVDLPLSHEIPASTFAEIMSENGFVLRHVGAERLHVIAIEHN